MFRVQVEVSPGQIADLLSSEVYSFRNSSGGPPAPAEHNGAQPSEAPPPNGGETIANGAATSHEPVSAASPQSVWTPSCVVACVNVMSYRKAHGRARAHRVAFYANSQLACCAYPIFMQQRTLLVYVSTMSGGAS